MGPLIYYFEKEKIRLLEEYGIFQNFTDFFRDKMKYKNRKNAPIYILYKLGIVSPLIAREQNKMKKRLKYFLENNIKYDKIGINVGDEVVYAGPYGHFIGTSRVATIDYMRGTVLLDSGYFCDFGSVKKVNGKDFEPFYYIKLKGKTYGID